METGSISWQTGCTRFFSAVNFARIVSLDFRFAFVPSSYMNFVTGTGTGPAGMKSPHGEGQELPPMAFTGMGEIFAPRGRG
jgi:hypothetical protein